MTVAKPSALQEAWCEAGGRRVRYLVGGDGPPLVLVHGLGGSASNWVELWPELAKPHESQEEASQCLCPTVTPSW